MSGEGNKSSFGSSRPQPPTPRQTPTSAVFPASVLQTPKDDRTTFDDPTLATPRFAEEYSVFNSTPGNLRGGHGHGHFPDFAAHSPYLNSAPKKRPVSIESLAAEVASHANHFTQNQNLPLPPVDPSRRLSSSPAGLLLGSAFTEPLTPTSLAHRSKRRDHRKDLQEAASIQIETPPPSTHKGGRRLAPRLHDEAMQDEQLYAHDFVAGPGHQQNMGSFTLASPTDMFGFPLAPATAPAFTEARSFWDTDMTGMEMDFSMADASMFQAAAAAGHRPGDSMDWGRPSDIFPTQGMMLPQHQDPSKALQQNTKKERTLAPKPLAGNGGELSGLNDSFPINMEDPFALAGPPGGVDPGLLFTRPGSSGMIPATYDPLGQLPLLGDSMLSTDLSQAPFSFEAQGELRRSASSRDVTSKKGERIAGAAPPKALGRPGLSRSVSENRGRKTLARSATLPTLAPANRTMAPPPQQQPPQKSSRPAASNSRAGGRVSPFKHNRRLSSLASIPESASPRTRTEVKFTIDSRGRARAETTTVVVGKGTSSDRPPRASDSSRKNRSPSKSWASGEDDSSSDDEPIIIPSRNSSFMMPDHPRPASSSNGYHTSRRSISESSASSLSIYFNEQREQELAQQDGETSDAETVLNVPDANRAVGDATSELRKMVQTRQKHMSLDTSRSFVAASAHSAGAISPTKFGDASLPTPSSDRGSHVRCVCSSTQSRINGDAYMVQCESCEMYLHGKCINITRQTHPKVYICAFCANTSNMQSQGARDPRLGRSGNCMPRSASSPLAHKSFKSFR